MKRRKAIKIAATAAAATMFSSARAAFKDRAPEKKEYRAIATDRFYESASPDDIFPKIFEAGKKSHLSIRLPSSVAKTENLRFVCASEDGFALDMSPYFPEYRTLPNDNIPGYAKQPPDFSSKTPPVAFELRGDFAKFDNIVFPKEGRYVFCAKDKKNATLLRAWVYALKPDLFELRPYIGDIHMHTTHSDGRDSNLEMALVGLSRGFDFMAVSDHGRRIGSTSLIEEFRCVPTSLKLFPGEEAHGSLLHINNFDSSGGIAEWVRENRADFDARTERILKTIPESLGLGKLDKLTLAQSEAVFEKIREMGGMSVFNHPYWRRNGEQLNCSDSLRDALISRQKFDAYEIVNGSINYDSSDLSAARHAEAAQDGYFMPIVGCSDAHKSDELGCGITVAFAKSKESADIRKAIMSLNTIAVDTSGSFERPKMYGKMRLVKYASFLWKNFFPLHENLCAKQSAALRKYFESGASDASVSKELEASIAELEKLYAKVWA